MARLDKLGRQVYLGIQWLLKLPMNVYRVKDRYAKVKLADACLVLMQAVNVDAHKPNTSDCGVGLFRYQLRQIRPWSSRWLLGLITISQKPCQNSRIPYY
ncbi:hypothetical protein CDV31_007827 [Fusarium ambrosium]|uniref:Uncharacterized protein n=1 Tax=Fusarium ambrosium TaxID=131363 RepID=A0A428U413_9HYPO|nr:hypothetical protein CDV31_007827 [Fusarium ambrosium]